MRSSCSSCSSVSSRSLGASAAYSAASLSSAAKSVARNLPSTRGTSEPPSSSLAAPATLGAGGVAILRRTPSASACVDAHPARSSASRRSHSTMGHDFYSQRARVN
eukprot:scaffold4279_cov99-Isochrysis_galbana.AAC.12